MEQNRLVDSLGAQVGVLTVQVLEARIQLEDANTRIQQLIELTEKMAEEKTELVERNLRLEGVIDALEPAQRQLAIDAADKRQHK